MPKRGRAENFSWAELDAARNLRISTSVAKSEVKLPFPPNVHVARC